MSSAANPHLPAVRLTEADLDRHEAERLPIPTGGSPVMLIDGKPYNSRTGEPIPTSMWADEAEHPGLTFIAVVVLVACIAMLSSIWPKGFTL